MRTVRVFYKKLNRMKFISHLDMTRFMSRLIKKAGIPVWYTEGFNQHLYMNFAVPLSLGFEGLYEIVEIRIMDEHYSNEACLVALKSVSPPDIEFVSVNEPQLSMKEIGFAEFELNFFENAESLKEKVEPFLSKDSIICEKKGKKGKIKEIDIIPKIGKFSFDGNILTLRLIAGTEDNLNPTLVMDTFFEQTKTEPKFYSVTRTAILTKDGGLFA